MSLEQILFLAIIQGVTEFLPVSSSAHLALAPTLLGWKDQGVIMDVAAHMGTLGSLLVYFRKDVLKLFRGFFGFFTKKQSKDTTFFLQLCLATLPVVIIGFLFEQFVGDHFRSTSSIAWMSIIFGFILYLADRFSFCRLTFSQINYKHALLFGLAQCLAVINGVSRSGITLTIGRMMSFTRVDSARFIFLMAIPTVAAAGILKGYKLIKTHDFTALTDAGLLALFSFIFGLITITFMMKWLQRHTFAPFAIYRILLGLFLLLGLYNGYFS